MNSSSSHMHTHTQASLQEPRGQSNQIPFLSQKGRLPAVWQAACVRTGRAQLTLQGAEAGLHPHSQLLHRPAPCLTAVPPDKGGPVNTH